MACRVCKAKLVQVAVSRSKLHQNLGGGYAYATPGPIHCLKCKIVYCKDPDGDEIEIDTSLLDKEPKPSENP